MTDTLCWACKNACGRCNWSRINPGPVPGWDAIETEVRISRDMTAKSYDVIRCPEFEWDGREEYEGCPEKRKKKRSKKTQKAWTHDEVVKMHELRKTGMSWPQVAHALGRTIGSVRGQRLRLGRRKQ